MNTFPPNQQQQYYASPNGINMVQSFPNQQQQYYSPNGIPAPLNVNPDISIPGFEYTTNRRWKDSVFDCFYQMTPSCCMACFCPCVLMGQISQKLRVTSCCTIASTYIALCVLLFIIALAANTGALIFLFCWGFCFCLAWLLRSRVREILMIPGSPIEDFLLSLFCTCCTTAQLARQVFNYRESCDSVSWDDDGTPLYHRGAQNFAAAHNANVQYVIAQPPVAVVQTYTTAYPQMYATNAQPQSPGSAVPPAYAASSKYQEEVAPPPAYAGSSNHQDFNAHLVQAVAVDNNSNDPYRKV